MRIFFTSLMAFVLSGFAGGIVAQQLAVMTGATEEYILVFMFVVLLAVMFTVVFYVPQFRANARRAVNATAKGSFILFAVLVLALLGWEYWAVGGDVARLRNDVPIIAGLILPGAAVILVQWLFVRWRVGDPPASFGRSGQAS